MLESPEDTLPPDAPVLEAPLSDPELKLPELPELPALALALLPITVFEAELPEFEPLEPSA